MADSNFKLAELAQRRADKERELRTQAEKMVAKLEEHLDYCGWGDSWERECSKELQKELAEFNIRKEKNHD